MKQLLMGIGLCSAAMMAFAGEKVDKTIDADSDGYVKIEHVNGKAVIKGWNKSQVKVVGELGDRTEEFKFRRRGDEVIIKVEVENGGRKWGSWSSSDGDDLEIFVPKNSRVKYEAINATVSVSDILGGSDIETVNGDIDVDDLSGRIQVEAVNGDIDATGLQGDVTLATVNGDISDRNSTARGVMYESVNGDIEVSSNSPEFNAETVNGDMELKLETIEEMTVSTVNGSINATMELAKNGDVRANSVGGSIELNFQKNVSARFDIQGHAGGRITNNITDDKVKKAKYGPSRWLEFSVNGGDAKVDVSTVSGRIKLNNG